MKKGKKREKGEKGKRGEREKGKWETRKKREKRKMYGIRERMNTNLSCPACLMADTLLLVSPSGSIRKPAPPPFTPHDEGVFCVFCGTFGIFLIPSLQQDARRSGIQLRWGPALLRTWAPWERQ